MSRSMPSRPPIGLLLASLVAALVAAGCSGGSERCEPEPPATLRPLFRTDAGARTVFPSNLFCELDPSTPTGLQLALPAEGTPVIAQGLEVLMAPGEFAGLLSAHDGFSTWGPVLVPLSGAPDPASPPASAADSIEPYSPVALVDLTAGQQGGLERVPITVEAVALAGDEHLLVLRPTRPLAPGRRHAVLITDGLKASDGSPAGPTADTSFALGRCPVPDDHSRRELLLTRREQLAELFSSPGAPDPERVVLAEVFTTQSVDRELSEVRRVLREVLPAPRVDLDPDGDGQPDLYPPAELPGAPASALHLEHVALVVRGTYESPALRGPEGAFVPGEDGLPEVQAMETVPFVLALPADPAFQPFPVVVMQHGHGGTKERLLYLAGHFAARGMATVAIDLVEHGERPRTGHGFLDFSNIPAIRANFEQSAVDVMRLVQAVEGLAELDLVPAGGDGTPDLDLGRLAMVGESAGAQVTSLVGALEPSIGAVVINVGGGGYSNLLEHYLGGFYAPDVIIPLGVLVQTLFDPADPLNFYRPYLSRGAQGPEVQALLQEVIDDVAMPNPATEDLARVYGVPLLRPVAREVAGHQVVDYPALGQGLVQYNPAKHGFLLAEEEDLEASEAVRRQVTGFLDSYFTDGEGLIDDPL